MSNDDISKEEMIGIKKGIADMEAGRVISLQDLEARLAATPQSAGEQPRDTQRDNEARLVEAQLWFNNWNLGYHIRDFETWAKARIERLAAVSSATPAAGEQLERRIEEAVNLVGWGIGADEAMERIRIALRESAPTEAAPIPRERLLEVLQEGVDLVWSSIAHVSHGGPTKAEAETWVNLGRDILAGNNPPKPLARAAEAKKPA